MKTRNVRQGHRAASARLWDQQKTERGREFAAIDSQKAKAVAAVKVEFKPQWTELYRGQWKERRRVEKLCQSLTGRLHIVLTRGRDLGLKGADVFRPNAIKKAVEKRLAEERQPLSNMQTKAYRAAVRPFDQLKSEMKAEQKTERDTLRDEQRGQLSELWDRQKIGGDRGEFQEFEKQAQATSRNLRDALIKSFGQEAVLEAEIESKRIEAERTKDRDHGRKLRR